MIQGKRIQLRPWCREDIDLFLDWFNDPEVTQYLGNAYPNVTREDEESFYDQGAKDKYRYGIETLGDGRLIGNCELGQVNLVHRSAMIGIVIGDKECWNQGYGREAIGLLLEIGFDGLNLHRIWLEYGAFNARGERCYRALGFREEGRRRDAWYVRGTYHDLVMMGILEQEYRERQQAGAAG
jgi:RimJ/RimL family protein N-acetyltransferase